MPFSNRCTCWLNLPFTQNLLNALWQTRGDSPLAFIDNFISLPCRLHPHLLMTILLLWK